MNHISCSWSGTKEGCKKSICIGSPPFYHQIRWGLFLCQNFFFKAGQSQEGKHPNILILIVYRRKNGQNRPETALLHRTRREIFSGSKFMLGGINMPRMSKKRKEELALFLNEHHRITCNKLCRKCKRGCKQSFRAEVIQCPLYQRKGVTLDD